MDIASAASTMKRVLNDCAYDFGSTSYQDRCDGIRVTYTSSEINVYVTMTVRDSYYDSEVKENIMSTVRSIRTQYGIPYGINVSVTYNRR